MHRFTLSTILILPIVFIVIISSTVIAFISIDKYKQLSISSVERQVESSAEMINEKVSILKSTVTNQEFNSKLSYALLLNQNNYKKLGLTPMQFKITKDKKLEGYDGFESPIPQLPMHVIEAEVSAVVDEVSRKTQSMVTSMGEVSLISNQFAGSIQQVAAAAQEQSTAMDEISGDAEDLNDMANGFEELVGKFKSTQAAS